jgi:magnesium-transporting ATPase (P-type)
MGLHEAVDIRYDIIENSENNPFEFNIEDNDENNTFFELFIGFTRIVLTFHIFMPFNWFGLIEISYWILSKFVEWDENIKRNKDEKVEIIYSHSLANFGQVRHILTDKTGTLTKRIFELKVCSIHGKLYSFQFDELKDDSYIYHIKEDDINELEILQEARSQSKYAPLIKEFLESLCLCHSVKVSHLNTNINKKINIKKKKNDAQQEQVGGADMIDENGPTKNEEKDFASPYCEEVATFKVLNKLGYKLVKSKANLIQLKINDKKRNYAIIGHNKYNKDRKK